MSGLSFKVAAALALSVCLAGPAPARQEPPQQPREQPPCHPQRGDLHLVEGLTIRRVGFYGNEHTSDSRIRRALRLEEGEAFTVRELRKGLARVHRLGIFKKVGDGDIEWCSTDGQPGQVDFVILFEYKPAKRRGKR